MQAKIQTGIQTYLNWNITKQGLKLACDGGGCLQLGFDKIDGL